MVVGESVKRRALTVALFLSAGLLLSPLLSVLGCVETELWLGAGRSLLGSTLARGWPVVVLLDGKLTAAVVGVTVGDGDASGVVEVMLA